MVIKMGFPSIAYRGIFINDEEELTLVWANDNYGYIRRYPSDREMNCVRLIRRGFGSYGFRC